MRGRYHLSCPGERAWYKGNKNKKRDERIKRKDRSKNQGTCQISLLFNICRLETYQVNKNRRLYSRKTGKVRSLFTWFRGHHFIMTADHLECRIWNVCLFAFTRSYCLCFPFENHYIRMSVDRGGGGEGEANTEITRLVVVKQQPWFTAFCHTKYSYHREREREREWCQSLLKRGESLCRNHGKGLLSPAALEQVAK